MNIKSRPSVVPSLATVPSSKEEEEEQEIGEEKIVKNEQKEQITNEREQSAEHVDRKEETIVKGNKQILTGK